MVALASLCRLCEIDVELISTDQLTCHLLAQHGFQPQSVHAWAQAGWHRLDRWSGAVLLSHDHDDEAGVLADILSTPAFMSALWDRAVPMRGASTCCATWVLPRMRWPAFADLSACRSER
jgi:hypothetical protein